MAMLNNQMVHHAYQFLGPKHRIFAKDWTFFWTSDPDPDPSQGPGFRRIVKLRKSSAAFAGSPGISSCTLPPEDPDHLDPTSGVRIEIAIIPTMINISDNNSM